MNPHRTLLSGWGSFARGEANSLWILAERIVGSLLNFLAVLAIMRGLGPEAYGQWAFAFSIISVMLATGHLGLDGLLVRKLVEKPDQAHLLLGVTAALKYAVYLPVITGTVFFVASQPAVTQSERSLLSVLIIAVLFAPLTSTFVAWLNAKSHFPPAARARILATIIGFTAKISLVAAGVEVVKVGIAHSAMLALEAAILASVVYQNGGPMPWRWRFEKKTATLLLSQSLYLFAATIFATLYFNVDVMVLRAYGTALDVGLYALVPQVVLASQMLPYAVTLSRFPKLAEIASDPANSKDFREEVRRTILHLVALAGVTMAGLALFLTIGFDMVFGSAYSQTKPILWLAILVFPALFLRQLSTKLFILADQGRSLAVIECSGLVLVATILLTTVPRYGATAAILAVTSGVSFTVAISFLKLRKQLGFSTSASAV